MTLDISQKVRTDLRDVAGSTSSRKGGLEVVEPRGALPARRGVGEPRQAEAVGGGGIAGPLTEKTREEGGVQVPDRDYWPTTLFSTSDGLLLFEFRPTRVWRLTDADGEDVTINVARPKSETLS